MEMTTRSRDAPSEAQYVPILTHLPMKPGAPWEAIFLLPQPFHFNDLMMWYWACLLDNRRDAAQQQDQPDEK